MKKHEVKHDRAELLLAADESPQGTLSGTRYRKQIARFGKYMNPNYPWFDDEPYMEIDQAFAQEMIENFNAKNGVDRIPVPRNHTGDVSANTGEVVGLELTADGSGLDAIIEFRDDKTVADVEAGLIWDVSMGFDWNFIDQETGDNLGIVLMHLALTDEPYLTKMKGFETVKEAVENLTKKFFPSALANNKSGVIMLSVSKAKELKKMNLATIKNDKAYSVKIKVKDEDGEEVEKELKAGEEIEVPKEQAEEVTNQISEAKDPEAEDDNDTDEDTDTDTDTDTDVDEDDNDDDEDAKTALAKSRAKLARYENKDKFSTLLSKGKIVPAQKAKFQELAKVEIKGSALYLSGKKVSLSSLVAGILEAGPKIVDLSKETGSNKEGEDKPKNDDDKSPSKNLSEAERAGMEAVGASPERMDELAKEHPAMKQALNEIDENKGDK